MKRVWWTVALTVVALAACGDALTDSATRRYVDVPELINLEKRAGEPVTIELQKTPGKPAVVRAY